jgi:hypothetical protein
MNTLEMTNKDEIYSATMIALGGGACWGNALGLNLMLASWAGEKSDDVDAFTIAADGYRWIAVFALLACHVEKITGHLRPSSIQETA